MAIKFKHKRKGRITQLFGGNPALYKGRALGHNGVDYSNGWDSTVTCDNDALVYKVVLKHQSRENWQGVYMIIHLADDKYMEVCQGHFNEVLVTEGQWIPAFCPIGKEGNKGYVFSGGKQITPAMQEAGDRRGTHTHESWRPVMRVPQVVKGEFYLEDGTGKPFRDSEGYVYQIIHKNNGYRGCVDPMLYRGEDSAYEELKTKLRYYKWAIAQKQK